MALVAVSNSSPLIVLSKISCLDVLEQLVGDVLIPPAVRDELAGRSGLRPGAEKLAEATWIIAQELDDKSVPKRLMESHRLGAGEPEAIALSEQVAADLVLLDERRARRVAASRGLRVLGTLGILEKAYEQGLLPEFPAIIRRIQDYGLYLSRELIKASLERFQLSP